MSVIPESAVEAAKRAVVDNFHGPDDKHSTWWLNSDEMARAVLAAAAPEIERAAKAAALREAADLAYEASVAWNALPSSWTQGFQHALSMIAAQADELEALS